MIFDAKHRPPILYVGKRSAKGSFPNIPVIPESKAQNEVKSETLDDASPTKGSSLLFQSSAVTPHTRIRAHPKDREKRGKQGGGGEEGRYEWVVSANAPRNGLA